MSKFIASCIQMNIVVKNQEANLNKALELIDRAIENDARLICLPELFTTGFDYDYIEECASPLPHPVISALAQKAKDAGVFIVSGSVPLKCDDKIYNTSFLIDNQGNTSGSYKKINLFPLMDEDTQFAKGDKIEVFQSELGSLGIMICYDIRFPEIARTLAKNGAQVIIVPAEFPNPRLDHWKTLLKARAIENQVYIIGVNRVGRDYSNSFFGNSCIIDPWGQEVALAYDFECVINGSIDTDKILEVRRKLPCIF